MGSKKAVAATRPASPAGGMGTIDAYYLALTAPWRATGGMYSLHDYDYYDYVNC